MKENNKTIIFKDVKEFNNYLYRNVIQLDEHDYENDNHNNGCSKEFLLEHNITLKEYEKRNRGNINCWNCWDCTECWLCWNCENCQECFNCKDCLNCEVCEDCKNCIECNRCDVCENIEYGKKINSKYKTHKEFQYV